MKKSPCKKKREHRNMALKAILWTFIFAIFAVALIGHVIVMWNEIAKYPMWGVLASIFIASFGVTFAALSVLCVSIAKDEYQSFRAHKIKRFCKEVLFEEYE